MCEGVDSGYIIAQLPSITDTFI